MRLILRQRQEGLVTDTAVAAAHAVTWGTAMLAVVLWVVRLPGEVVLSVRDRNSRRRATEAPVQ